MEKTTTYIDFVVPRGWHELTDAQLRYVYNLIALDMSAEEIAVTCLLQWSGTKVIGRQPDCAFLLQREDSLFEAKPLAIAELISQLGWLAELPPIPVRLSSIGDAKAIAADFQGVPFESYIICDNLYQGLLAQGLDDSEGLGDELYAELAKQLYPGVSPKPSTLKPFDKINIFYWLASLKGYFSRRFPDFFQPAAGASEGNMLGSPDLGTVLQEAMDAQIRALTKGDITKEREILSLDTWRALTELNAQAREYKLMKSMTAKK